MSIIALTALDVVPFTPPQLSEREPPAVFYLRIPTFSMRDKMAATLFSAGFIPAMATQGRSLLINALYTHYDEAKADECATFLESFWTRQELHDEVMQGWQIQEATRLFDMANGAGDLPQAPVPPAPYSMREQSRHVAITTDLLAKDEQYRAYQARFLDVQAEEDEMLVRLFIDRWENVGDVKPERDAGGRLTMACIEAIRLWMRDNGAADAWKTVVQAVKEQFGAPGGLEKNFESLPDMNSNPTGSPKPSGASESSDGSLTELSTELTPGSDSSETSGPSPASPSAKIARKPRRGRTVSPS